MFAFLRNPLTVRIRNIVIIGLIAFVIAYCFDQYYIYDRKWFFILDLIR